MEAGFRHLDCAERYRNEAAVGDAIQEAFKAGTLRREDLFVTTKLWNTNHRPERVKPAFDASCRRLQLDYIDCYIIHTPFAFQPGDEQDPRDEHGRVIYDSGVTLVETWRALERLVDDGHCKSIGLSDITLEKLREIVAAARIKPAIVQVESHPYLPEWELLDFCREHGIVLQAFAALGHAMEPNLLADPVITAIAQRVHKTPAQVALAWAVQRGTAFLTTSTKPRRIQESFDISALPEDAMREIRDRITTNVRFNSVVETGVPGFIPGARRTEFSGAEPQVKVATSAFGSQVREVERTQRQLLALFAESLSISLAVRIEELLAALLPRSFEFGRCDVPVRPAFPADGTQVLAEFFHRGPSEEPVAIVDLVNDKAGLQHNHVRNHRIVDGVGVFGDVEILLNDAPRIGEKGPVSAYSAAIFVGLGDIVGADRDQPAIADLHLTMELQQTFGLTAIFWAEGAAAEHEHHGILSLQLGEFSMLRGMIAELIVGENGSGHHVGSHLKSSTVWRVSKRAARRHKSITTSPAGCAQQISTLPSAGASTGSGR